MHRALAWLFVAMFAALTAVPAGAQLPDPVVHAVSGHINFAFQPETSFRWVSLAPSGVGPSREPISRNADFPFVIIDMSTDVSENGSPNVHRVDFDFTCNTNTTAWRCLPAFPSIQLSQRGQRWSGLVTVQTEAFNTVITASMTVSATMRSYYENARQPSVTINQTFTARIFPAPALLLEIINTGPYTAPLRAVPPNDFFTIPVRVTNNDLYPQKVHLDLQIAPGDGVDPAVIPVIGEGPFLLEPLKTYDFNITILAPKAKFWYNSIPLVYTVSVTNSQNPNVGYTASSVVIIEGFYLSRQIWLVVPIVILLLVILILFLILAKRYYDEHLLGKPIPPWRIPEEAARLEELRKTDPRTFYVTRYFLMEEEYASALLWFHSFKRRAKRTIKAEARSVRYQERAEQLATPSLVRFDRKAERLKRRMHRRQERRRLQLEAKLERLQSKLDQHYESDYDKDHKKWEEKVEKAKKKANKPWFRAHRKWEREVEKLLEDWEKPFRKEKEKHDKQVAKILQKYEKQVKKKDKRAWKDWKEAVENAKKENELRKREGREPIPLPELRTQEAEYPELPKAFKAPPKPRLPPEPEEPVLRDLPPEPKLEKPSLDESHYARKARRLRKKTDRKVRRLEKKLNRLLARNERDRVRALAKADRKRNKLLRKSKGALEPTVMQRLFRLTPEDRERRAHRKLLKALAKEKVRSVEEEEQTRLELLEVEAKRREAELLAKVIRGKAEVKRAGFGAAAPMDRPAETDEGALEDLRKENEARLERERAKSKERLADERTKVQKELHEQLTEELIKERLGPAAAAPKEAEATTARPRRKK